MNNTQTFQKMDVYTFVTNKIIEQLEKGIIPWKQCWQDARIPRNLVTRRQYHGIGVWLLASPNYPQHWFLSWRQVHGLRGTIRKKENPCISPYWLWYSRKEQREKRKTATLCFSKLYNVSQCLGLPAHLFRLEEPYTDPIEECEEIISRIPNCPSIIHDTGLAYYDEEADYVNVPEKDLFDCPEKYYTSLFKQLIHATGHRKRLHRKEFARWTVYRSEPCILEELIAEIGASYLSMYAGLAEEPEAPHTAYIQSLLRILKKNNRFIISICDKAQQAADYILNVQREYPQDFV